MARQVRGADDTRTSSTGPPSASDLKRKATEHGVAAIWQDARESLDYSVRTYHTKAGITYLQRTTTLPDGVRVRGSHCVTIGEAGQIRATFCLVGRRKEGGDGSYSCGGHAELQRVGDRDEGRLTGSRGVGLVAEGGRCAARGRHNVRSPAYRLAYHSLSVQNALTRYPELPVPTYRNVNVELGELAIAMETRAHGHVSMEPVTRPNNQDPLDRRSIVERLGNVSPTDPALPFDANADAELVCVTANNGLCGVSRHSVVPQRMEEELQAQLSQAMDTDRMMRLSSSVPGPRTGRDSWAWMATDSDGALVVMVHARGGTKWFPAAAFAVGNGRKGLISWEAVWLDGPPDHERWPPPPSWDTDGPLHVPTGRWLILRLFPNVLSFGEEASWLIGFSRCVAWAWLLLGRPRAPNRLYTEAESPLINRWTRAIARSMDASGSAVAVESRGWHLAASDGTAEMGETCLAICLWPPNAPGPGAGSPIVLVIRPGPDMDARIDRHPGLSGQSLPADLDDYVERVMAAAAGVYWAKRGLPT